jgi:TorA maturation chaperone TorD
MTMPWVEFPEHDFSIYVGIYIAERYRGLLMVPPTEGDNLVREPGEDDARDQLHRAGAYSYLAALVRAEPDAELLQQVSRFADIENENDAGEMEAAMSMLGKAAQTCTEAEIRDEFFQLFIGLGRGELVPYGSWYQTGFLMEKPLGELRDDLKQLGFERDSSIHEPEDHVAALWEVMAMLIKEGRNLDTQRHFFETHLGKWIDRFNQDLETAGSATFYTAVARFAAAFTDFERGYMGMEV